MDMALAELRSGNVQQFYATTTPEVTVGHLITFGEKRQKGTRLIGPKPQLIHTFQGLLISLLEKLSTTVNTSLPQW